MSFRTLRGLRAVGHTGDGFAFDNELPRHRAFLEPYQLATRLVTNSEYLEFVGLGIAKTIILPTYASISRSSSTPSHSIPIQFEEANS
jgi:formylglycine-generating enzyme required for sulfatase activity